MAPTRMARINGSASLDRTDENDTLLWLRLALESALHLGYERLNADICKIHTVVCLFLRLRSVVVTTMYAQSKELEASDYGADPALHTPVSPTNQHVPEKDIFPESVHQLYGCTHTIGASVCLHNKLRHVRCCQLLVCNSWTSRRCTLVRGPTWPELHDACIA
jgi:hypothetical protein